TRRRHSDDFGSGDEAAFLHHRASRDQRLPGTERQADGYYPLWLVDGSAPPPHSGKWGFKPEGGVPILEMGGVPPILGGMQSKKILGGALSRPPLIRAKQEGYGELADAADLVPDYQVAGVVPRRSFIKQNHEIVRGFVKAIAEATATFKSDPAYVK